MPTETISIFVDLDETLVHSLGMKTIAGDLGDESNLCDKPVTIVLSKKEQYVTVLRPGANYLLFRLREVGKVYMLTRATKDYAIAMNKAFNFGFDEDRIFDRNFQKYKIPKNISQGRNFLIDDLDVRDNYEKVAFIKRYGTVRYINVRAFYGEKGNEFTSSYIQEIIEEITNA
jgi:NLI interacting factor-like phosphatase